MVMILLLVVVVVIIKNCSRLSSRILAMPRPAGVARLVIVAALAAAVLGRARADTRLNGLYETQRVHLSYSLINSQGSCQCRPTSSLKKACEQVFENGLRPFLVWSHEVKTLRIHGSQAILNQYLDLNKLHQRYSRWAVFAEAYDLRNP